MNLYDTKLLVCIKCESQIGEIDLDAQVTRPLCGKCANPLSKEDKIRYTVSCYSNNHTKAECLQTIPR